MCRWWCRSYVWRRGWWWHFLHTLQEVQRPELCTYGRLLEQIDVARCRHQVYRWLWWPVCTGPRARNTLPPPKQAKLLKAGRMCAEVRIELFLWSGQRFRATASLFWIICCRSRHKPFADLVRCECRTRYLLPYFAWGHGHLAPAIMAGAKQPSKDIRCEERHNSSFDRRPVLCDWTMDVSRLEDSGGWLRTQLCLLRASPCVRAAVEELVPARSQRVLQIHNQIWTEGLILNNVLGRWERSPLDKHSPAWKKRCGARTIYRLTRRAWMMSKTEATWRVLRKRRFHVQWWLPESLRLSLSCDSKKVHRDRLKTRSPFYTLCKDIQCKFSLSPTIWYVWSQLPRDLLFIYFSWRFGSCGKILKKSSCALITWTSVWNS